jgi:ADP-ribose pyrophosphatase YjhB (NUDIX family)
MKAHYCLECGTQLQNKQFEGREREVCPNCGWVNYEHRKLSAGVRIEQDGKLLLVQRGIDPWYMKWYMPAGYMEVDEDPDQAAIRETLEETGLSVKILGLAGIYTYSDDPRGNGLVLLYDAKIIGGKLKVTSETLQAGFFSIQEIEKMQFAGASAGKQVHDWIISDHRTRGSLHD